MSDALDRAFVVGLGEVGRRLAAALRSAAVEVVEVTRTAGWSEATSDLPGPRLLAVREEDLAGVLARLATVPAERLVLVQNGWVRPLLERPDAVTRGLIWFTSKGDFFRVLRPSPFAGPCAAPLAAALDRSGLAATAVGARDFAGLEADKMGFNCVVGLPLAVHGLSLGDYLVERRTEAEALFGETVTVCARALGVQPDPAWWPAFLASCEPLHWVRASQAKALGFRNLAVVRLARELGLEAPLNAELLAAVGR
jgi:hypothetical protein